MKQPNAGGKRLSLEFQSITSTPRTEIRLDAHNAHTFCTNWSRIRQLPWVTVRNASRVLAPASSPIHSSLPFLLFALADKHPTMVLLSKSIRHFAVPFSAFSLRIHRGAYCVRMPLHHFETSSSVSVSISFFYFFVAINEEVGRRRHFVLRPKSLLRVYSRHYLTFLLYSNRWEYPNQAL